MIEQVRLEAAHHFPGVFETITVARSSSFEVAQAEYVKMNVT